MHWATVNVVLTLVTCAQAGEPLRRLLPDGYALVRGQVVRVMAERETEVVIGNIAISHVYYGHAELLRQTFTASSTDMQRKGTGVPGIIPAFALGEDGVWLILLQKDGIRHKTNSFHGLGCPARQSSPLYNGAIQIGEAMQQVARERSADGQFRVLQTLACSQRAHAAGWAISLLAEKAAVGGNEHRLLRALVGERRLTLTARLALDEAILKFEKKEWQRSPERMAYLVESINRARIDDDLARIRRRLDYLAQQPEAWGFEQPDLLALLKAVLENPNAALAARRNVWPTIKWIPMRYNDDAPLFEFLLDTLKHSAEPQLQHDAAQYLAQVCSKDETRRAQVREAIEAVQDRSLARQLLDAFDRPKPGAVPKAGPAT